MQCTRTTVLVATEGHGHHICAGGLWDTWIGARQTYNLPLTLNITRYVFVSRISIFRYVAFHSFLSCQHCLMCQLFASFNRLLTRRKTVGFRQCWSACSSFASSCTKCETWRSIIVVSTHWSVSCLQASTICWLYATQLASDRQCWSAPFSIQYLDRRVCVEVLWVNTDTWKYAPPISVGACFACSQCSSRSHESLF